VKGTHIRGNQGDPPFEKKDPSLEMEMVHLVYLEGHNCPKNFVQKLNGQLCPSKYTKWSEKERSCFRMKGSKHNRFFIFLVFFLFF
jgi:hypothetical protein